VLVLVRHGESTANAAGLLLGRTDAELTARGRAQAAALRPLLGPVIRLVSSPLRRALDSAAALDAGRPVEVDPRWVEIDYGEHEARPLGDVPAEVWRRWRDDPDYRPAGAETMAEVAARVAGACEELFATAGVGARSRDGDVVVVSHMSPIKAAVSWALAADVGMATRLRSSTGSITRVAWGPAGVVLQSYNEVPAR
jgi:probable phosphoglycerate mutase